MIRTFSFWSSASLTIPQVIGTSSTGLWYSGDGGLVWSQVANSAITFNSAAIANNVGVASTSTNKIWISSNIANTWTQGATGISNNIPINSVAKNKNGSVFYAASFYGPYRSNLANVAGNWIGSNPLSPSSVLSNVTGGPTAQSPKSLFLARNGSNMVYYSGNSGGTWTTFASIGSAVTWSDATYSYGNLFFSGGNVVLRINAYINSGQGQTLSASAGNITCLATGAYQGNMYTLAYTSSGQVFRTSDNGLTWVSTANVGSAWSSAAYGKGSFVAVDTAGQVLFSANAGAGFTKTASFTDSMSSVHYANNIFMAVPSSTATNLVCYTSSEGVNWTARGNVGITCALASGLTFKNGVWYAIAPSGTTMAYSVDNGNSWANLTAGVNQTWYSISPAAAGVYLSGSSAFASLRQGSPMVSTLVTNIFPGNTFGTMYATSTVPSAVAKSVNDGPWTNMNLYPDTFGNVFTANANLIISSLGTNNKPSLYYGDPPKPAGIAGPPALSSTTASSTGLGNTLPITQTSDGSLLIISSSSTNSVRGYRTNGASFVSTLPTTTTWAGIITAENVTIVLPTSANVPVAITYDNGSTWSTGGMIPLGVKAGSMSPAAYTGGAIGVITNADGNYGTVAVSNDLGLTWGIASTNAGYVTDPTRVLVASNNGLLVTLRPNTNNFDVYYIGSGTGTGSEYNTALNFSWSTGGYWAQAIYGIQPNGTGVYVAINSNPTTGPAGAIYATSIGPGTWNASNLPLGSWTSLFYSSGYFITSNATGSIAYSRDGVSWTVNNGFSSGIYLLGGSSGIMVGLASGWTYTYTSRLPTSAAFVTALNGSRILAADTRGTCGVVYSDDGGQTWALSGFGTPATVRQIASNGSQTVVATDNGNMLNVSTNSGDHWSQMSWYGPFLSLAYTNGKFIGGHASGGIYVSYDGVNWEIDATANTAIVSSFAKSN